MRRWVLVATAVAALLLWWSRTGVPGPRPDPAGVADTAAAHRGSFASGRDGAVAGSGGEAAPAGRPSVDAAKRVRASSTGALEILVRDANGGRPLADVLVSVNPIGGDEQRQLLTEADGRALPAVEPGEYRIVVEKEGFLRTSLRIGIPSTGAPVRRQVSLLAVVTVEGVVLDQEGSPVEGAGVSFTPAAGSGVRRLAGNFTTDGGGRFAVQVPPSTTYRVRARKSPHPQAELRDVEVGPRGRPPLELRMNLRPDTVRLTGTVLSEDNEPIEGARVRLRYRSAGRRRTLASGRSRSDGGFEIELLPRSGIEMTTSAAGYRTRTGRNVSIRSDTRVDVKLAAYEAFEVRVVDPGGRTVDNPRVHGIDERGRRVLRKRPDGRYFASRYPVRVFADALDRNLGVSNEVVLDAYRSSVELVLQPGSRLNGRVARADGTPVTSFVVSIQPEGLAAVSRRVYAEDGSFSLQGLPYGNATVSVSASGLQRHRQELSLDGSRPNWIEVVLEPRQRRRSGERAGGARRAGQPP